MTQEEDRKTVGSADEALMMDLQSFVHSSTSEGIDLKELRSMFVGVDTERLIDALLELQHTGAIRITITHTAHDNDGNIDPEIVAGNAVSPFGSDEPITQ